MSTARDIVEQVLSPKMTQEIWSGNYDKVLPITINGFDLAAILPAVFYMLRFGYRWGRGEFLTVFGPETGTIAKRRRATTIARVADRLAQHERLAGFDNEAEKAVLGDLLLCFCLINANNRLGRDQQVQRVAPVHYMASWIDLPYYYASNLRYVPEMIVAMLANQDGEYVQRQDAFSSAGFPVGQEYEENVLVRAFYQGMEIQGHPDSLTADQFREENRQVGLDQILMIRLAQQLGTAPQKASGQERDRISNQHPIAEKAANNFAADIRRFVRTYSTIMPRHTFLEMLESCIALGLTTILTSVVEILFTWAARGEIPPCHKQDPTYLFVDCSNGVEGNLRAQAEASMDDFVRRAQRMPVILTALRLLDYKARTNRRIDNENIPTRPYATQWINMLGDVLEGRHTEAGRIRYSMEDLIADLADSLAEEYPNEAEMLQDYEIHPVWPLAETLTSLMGVKALQSFMRMIDAVLYADRPNGLAAKRSISQNVDGRRRRRVARSLVLTDKMLDFLVHLQLLRHEKQQELSLPEFLRNLRERYGFCVDTVPPGMSTSNDLLQRNRMRLERRLRELGLVTGVNDAESMKCLQPRFTLHSGE